MSTDLPTLRLLYLDADADAAVNLASGLGEMGFDVTHLPGGKGALSFLAGQGFDAVLLGPGECETLLDLSNIEDAPPVVCLTDGDCAVALQTLRDGADDFVTRREGKRFPRLLAAILARAVEAARLRKENRLARKEAQDFRERSAVMLHEMQHRIANSLALVVSMVHLQAGHTEDAEARASIATLAERISAIAQVHKGLYASPTIGTVALDSYLGRLVRELETGYRGRKALNRVSFEGIALSVSVDQAISLGVIVSELVGNAARFAYPKRNKGAVRVAVERGEDGSAELVVEDDGIGLSRAFDEDAGLGSQLISVLAHGLGGELSFETASDSSAGAGTRAILRFQMPDTNAANVNVNSLAKLQGTH